ncbi:hypothetical protein LJR290_007094 [Variovorax sp. LjRoot290]|uniref:hypothetical protein n=1 Tax=Variovorax sp. LjRoot290 TaxID=3342316 RepID=UPI003ED13F2D
MSSLPTDRASEQVVDLGEFRDAAWPEISSVADLGRILVILHGASAPSEAMLKKWSASGEFRECLIASRGEADPGGQDGANAKGTVLPGKPGRPGLRLATDKAIARVYELWPQLADSNPKAVFEEAVARTARQLSAVLRPLMHDQVAPAAPAHRFHEATPAAAPPSEELAEWQQRIEQVLVTLGDDVREMRREMAQFAALRNNLITRLDEVVARSRETLLATARADGGGGNPIVEARRDRDMGVLKSTIDQILSSLERLEASRGSQS